MSESTPDTPLERALDAAVAAHVFKLEVEQRTNSRSGEPDYVYRKPGQDWVRCAFYGSLGASLTLELKLRELGWKVKPSPLGRNPDQPGSVLVTLVKGEERIDATGATFEEALCRAALKAVEKP